MNSKPYTAGLDAVAAELRRAKRVLAITGAGISADSGLPTYRGIGGLYESDLTEDRMPIELALSGEMMRRQPQITWKYIQQIESACRQACYNAAHATLAQMQGYHQQFTVLTQNIDGFHTDAGSRDVIEIHGNLHELYCTVCEVGRKVSSYAGLNIPPACADCGGLLRPRVVLFGEMLPEPAMDRLHQLLEDGVDLVLTIGTTSVFPYIAAPVLRAVHSGVPTVEINPGVTEVSDQVSHRLAGRAAEVLPALLERVRGHF